MYAVKSLIIIIITRFAAPVSEEDLLKKITGSIPKATQKSTAWATTTWKDWGTNRQTAGNEFPPKLSEITNERLNYWLSRFVVKVRNKQGLEQWRIYRGARPPKLVRPPILQEN